MLANSAAGLCLQCCLRERQTWRFGVMHSSCLTCQHRVPIHVWCSAFIHAADTATVVAHPISQCCHRHSAWRDTTGQCQLQDNSIVYSASQHVKVSAGSSRKARSGEFMPVQIHCNALRQPMPAMLPQEMDKRASGECQEGQDRGVVRQRVWQHSGHGAGHQQGYHQGWHWC